MTPKFTGTFALAISTLAFVPTANADIIRCVFTEPFYTTQYSMVQQSLTITDSYSQYPKKIVKTIRNVSFQIKGPGRFELFDRNNKVIQKIYLTNRGSDGMSDFVYPYEVRWQNNRQVGGCESNFLRRTNPRRIHSY